MSGILATFARLKADGGGGGGGPMTLFPGAPYTANLTIFTGSSGSPSFQRGYSSPTYFNAFGTLTPSFAGDGGDWGTRDQLLEVFYSPTDSKMWITCRTDVDNYPFLFEQWEWNGMTMSIGNLKQFYQGVFGGPEQWEWMDGINGFSLSNPPSLSTPYTLTFTAYQLKSSGTVTVGWDGTNFYGFWDGNTGTLAPYLTGGFHDINLIGYDINRNVTQVMGVQGNPLGGVPAKYFGPSVELKVGSNTYILTVSSTPPNILYGSAYYEIAGDVLNLVANVGNTFSFQVVSRGF